MKNLGIHRFISQREGGFEASSYFVIRPWGNYLFHPQLLTDLKKEFFYSKGGLYRQFLSGSPGEITEHQLSLFSVFGACGVSFNQQFSPHMPIEEFGKEFYDPQIVDRGDFGVELYHQSFRILFLDEKIHFDRNKIQNLPSSLLEDLDQIDYFLFAFSRGLNLLTRDEFRLFHSQNS